MSIPEWRISATALPTADCRSRLTAHASEGLMVEYNLSEIATTTNRLVLRGRLDAAAADHLEKALSPAIDSAGRSVLADLSGVSFVGSVGIRLLVNIARGLHRRGLALVLLAPQPNVLDVLHSVGLIDLMPIVDSEVAGLNLVGN
jgi:anti-anti-sigma factor